MDQAPNGWWDRQSKPELPRENIVANLQKIYEELVRRAEEELVRRAEKEEMLNSAVLFESSGKHYCADVCWRKLMVDELNSLISEIESGANP